MPTILLKKSDTASAVPTTANLTNLAGGVEVAVNTADRRMFTMTSASAVVELGTNPSSLTLTGGTANGVLYLNGSKAVTSGSAFVFDGTNLGLGVTPSAWGSGKAIEVGSVGNSFWGTGATSNYLLQNAYHSGGAFRYASNNPASGYGQNSSNHYWYIAPSGTAGNAITFTQAMTLDASGNLMVGTTGAVGRFTLQDTGTTTEITLRSAGGVGNNNRGRIIGGYESGGSDYGGYLAFNTTSTSNVNTERARIDSSGNVGIAKTSPTSTLDVSGTISDVAGNVRNIPSAGAAKTSNYTLAITDIGEYVTIGTSGAITVPNDIFAAGNAVSLYNDTTGNATVSLTITTAYIAGANTDKASVALATRGLATILFINPSLCVITGNVS